MVGPRPDLAAVTPAVAGAALAVHTAAGRGVDDSINASDVGYGRPRNEFDLPAGIDASSLGRSPSSIAAVC